MKIEEYKIEFIDRILDPVHGFIDITQVEKEIIELDEKDIWHFLTIKYNNNWTFSFSD